MKDLLKNRERLEANRRGLSMNHYYQSFEVGEGVELTTDGLRKWLSDYKGSKLERKQLS